jgi:hypothetical protein
MLELHFDWTILAQAVSDPDVLGQMQVAFTKFIESGQGWALGIGLVAGFMFKSLMP